MTRFILKDTSQDRYFQGFLLAITDPAHQRDKDVIWTDEKRFALPFENTDSLVAQIKALGYTVERIKVEQ